MQFKKNHKNVVAFLIFMYLKDFIKLKSRLSKLLFQFQIDHVLVHRPRNLQVHRITVFFEDYMILMYFSGETSSTNVFGIYTFCISTKTTV